MKGTQKRDLFQIMDGAMGFMTGRYTPALPSEKYHDEINGITFDTCYTQDTGCYETGIKDTRYNNSWIIVEEYDTKKQSLAGHKKWIKKLTTGNPPKELPSVQMDPYPLLKGDE